MQTPFLSQGSRRTHVGIFTGFRPAVLALWILTLGAAQGQTKEEVKQQAESQLRQMTPEEIDKKLSEYGITREEAMRRAKEMNISLDELLIKRRTPETESEEVAPERARLLKESVSTRQQIPELKKPVIIPGFTGRPALKDTLLPFGYEMFRYPASAYEPVLNVATPTSYAIGPGDEMTIAMWGEARLNNAAVVNRDGNVVVPDVGPVAVNGLTIQQVRERLLRRMSSIYSGLKGGASNANTFLDVSLARLRTIQVFVLGEVQHPGGYSLSSMSTVFHALYRAGGATVNGTLRDVQIVRGGKPLPSVDVYDYLVNGSTTNDVRVQDADVVFVKPAAKRAAVQGSVVRPAIYELRKDETLGQLLVMAGGLRFQAYHERIHIERVIPFDSRKKYGKDLVDIDLSMKSLDDVLGSRFPLEDGDVVSVYSIASNPLNKVYVTGNVRKPGPFEFTEGMQVRDLVLKADSLDRNTFLERGILFRTLPDLRREVLSFNLGLALAGDTDNNLHLQNEDSVVVYKRSLFEPEQLVAVSGAVRFPGSYRRDRDLSVSDLMVLAGGLREDGITTGIVVSRIETTSVDVYSRVFKMDLPAEYWAARDTFLLRDFDHVFVPSNPKFSRQKLVSVSGYVMYPGSYAILSDKDRLADFIGRAGGFKPGAYLEASRLFRLGRDEGVIPLNFKPLVADTLEKARKIVNIIPVDFKAAVEEQDSRDNVLMRDGDSVFIAFREDVVYVRGEVIVPTPVLYKQGAGLSYYIKQAGGFSEEADENRTVVLLASGKKWESSWFLLPDPEILPGSSIYVPRKIEKEDKTLPIIRDMATILASIAAITIAIVQVTK